MMIHTRGLFAVCTHSRPRTFAVIEAVNDRLDAGPAVPRRRWFTELAKTLDSRTHRRRLAPPRS